MNYISLPYLFQIIFQSRIFPCHLCCPCQSLDRYKNRFMMQYQKHVSTSCMYLIPQNFVSVTIFDIVLCQLKSESTTIAETKSFASTHRNAIFSFHKMSSVAPACIHKHELIPFHNTLLINFPITYISLPCLCLISLFIFNLSKSRLLTSYICFQFRLQDHLAFTSSTFQVIKHRVCFK
jgi:hypothetical protein